MILFTADWHLKLGQKNVPVEWARNRYHLFFEQLREIEPKVSLHIVGGDIFDKRPNEDELALYFEFVRGATVRTLIFAGNHEATKKGKTFFTALKAVTGYVNPLVSVIDEIYEEDSFTIVPYEFIHQKGVWDKLDKSKALFTHVRGEIPPHVKPEIDLDLIADFPIVYVGDLHAHSNCQRNLVYPGSPMVTSFHRHPVDTGYLIIDGDDLTSWNWYKFDLPQLIRKTVTDPSEMIPTSPNHTIYEIEGSVVDLAGVKNSELLDKKLARRATDTTLILDKDMTVEQELVEYLRYVLELPDSQIQEAVTTYNDYVSKAEMG
jgi:hypothetical protein